MFEIVLNLIIGRFKQQKVFGVDWLMEKKIFFKCKKCNGIIEEKKLSKIIMFATYAAIMKLYIIKKDLI